MYAFFAFIVALFVTLVLAPGLAKVASRLKLVDLPNHRKVHAQPIPRCGGIAMALGTLVPLLMWTDLDAQRLSCIVAAGIVLIVGVWDDRCTIHYGWRLLGQVTAALIVMHAGIVLRHYPFFGLDPAPDVVSYTITTLFLVGLTNAVNLFDGLDGLAGGCVVLTLSTIALLGGQAGGDALALTCLSIIGATFGFLRYNTHPAKMFMGDAGSNWLGFTVGVLCIVLIEQHATALNPALPALLIGVPLLDLVAVVTQRLSLGLSPFAADRRHLHHKILDLGFRHYEAVALIYMVQAAMVATGLVLRFASDPVFIAAYATLAAVVVVTLLMLHKRRWRRPAPVSPEAREAPSAILRWRARLPALSGVALTVGLVFYLITGALAPVGISSDFALLALGTAGLVLADALIMRKSSRTMIRIGVYVSATAAAHFLVVWNEQSEAVGIVVGVLLACMGAVLLSAIVVGRRHSFQVTTQDLLILFLAIVIPNLTGQAFVAYRVSQMAAILVVVFYAAEFLLSREERVPTVIKVASIAGLGIMGLRGLLA